MDWQILFTIFFIALGPVKLIVPFATLTQHAESVLRREIALRSFALSLVTVVAMFFFGKYFLTKFNVGITPAASSQIFEITFGKGWC